MTQEKYIDLDILETLTNPDLVGIPAMMAMTRLKKALKKGDIIPENYAYIDDMWLAQKRQDNLQAAGKRAWSQGNNEDLPLEKRLEQLRHVRHYMQKGDFGWQVFGISERDYYFKRIALEVERFYDGLDNQADYHASMFDDQFTRRLGYELEQGTMLSEDDINAIIEACEKRRGKEYEKMKAGSWDEFQRLSQEIEDEDLSFSKRIAAIDESQRQIQRFSRTANEEQNRAYNALYDKRDALFQGHFQSLYNAAIETAIENPLDAFDQLTVIEKEIRDEGYDLDQVLAIEGADFYNKQDEILFNATDAVIALTNEMVDRGEPSNAFYTFEEYFSSRERSLEDAGHDISKIRDHSQKLLKVKTASEFDSAVAQTDVFNRANQLGAFAPGGSMSGDALDHLFGEDRANEMRGTAKNAFIDLAKDELAKYEADGDETNLSRADYCRADKFLQWSDITDDVEGLEALVKRNGHERYFQP